MEFYIRNGKVGSDEYIGFLNAPLRGREHPLILIVDRAPFHSSKKVRDFVRAHREKIRIYFLPPYSPELNPDEQVWNEIKGKKLGRKAIKNKPELKKKLNSALRSLQCQTLKIKALYGFQTDLECAGKTARLHRLSATGDPGGGCRELRCRVPHPPWRRRFPLVAMSWFGADAASNPKRRRAGAI